MATYFKSDTFAGVWVRVPLPAPTFSTPEETANRGGLFVWLLTTPCNAGINPRARLLPATAQPTYLAIRSATEACSEFIRTMKFGFLPVRGLPPLGAM